MANIMHADRFNEKGFRAQLVTIVQRLEVAYAREHHRKGVGAELAGLQETQDFDPARERHLKVYEYDHWFRQLMGVACLHSFKVLNKIFATCESRNEVKQFALPKNPVG
ncbi:MAG: hypothetical protein JWM99_1390 [Verrucomicrobiales bacterium]|nr:hypothetical protein [Verrucomicrobiales bacterium]